MDQQEEAKAFHDVEYNPIFQSAIALLKEIEPFLKGNHHYKVVSFLNRYGNEQRRA